MPIYEYQCKKCSTQFERRRPLADRDKRIACPECGSRATKRNAVQLFAAPTGVAPNAFEGDGEPEDFLGGDEFGGMGMDDDFDF